MMKSDPFQGLSKTKRVVFDDFFLCDIIIFYVLIINQDAG